VAHLVQIGAKGGVGTVDRLQALELGALVEVAQGVLPDLVGIDEPQTAAARVAALAALPEAAAGEMVAADPPSRRVY
jgi:hypothetical protein